MAGDECRKTRDPLAGRIPIILITGFLGSGKTTLLGRLLHHPGMDRAAVIINELGDVAIDHQLVAASSEQTTLLGSGCLCCTIRTDLQETLRELFIKRRAGEVIDFDRVFIETTGLADPVPVLHSFQSDGLPCDYADAALIELAERTGIAAIATIDQRDFSIYRLRGRRRFRILLP